MHDDDRPDLADRVGAIGRPHRYTQNPGGRETIDRQRDRAHVIARAWLAAVSAREEAPYDAGTLRDARITADEVADLLFAAHCELTSMKYRDRAAHKEGDVDLRKAVWYEAMALHALRPRFEPDPRAARRDFASYTRDAGPEPHEVTDEALLYGDERGNGGNLHIVLEDYNVSDESLAWCEAHAARVGDPEGAQIASALRQLGLIARVLLIGPGPDVTAGRVLGYP